MIRQALPGMYRESLAAVAAPKPTLTTLPSSATSASYAPFRTGRCDYMYYFLFKTIRAVPLHASTPLSGPGPESPQSTQTEEAWSTNSIPLVPPAEYRSSIFR